jgi:hypothetical protein
LNQLQQVGVFGKEGAGKINDGLGPCLVIATEA